ncbi:peptidase [Haloechinothrix sp. LS1_15]|uniref:trypsin-like serine peptidase n=1 Tax=Haloechinothrix sp. LS1_15 TaxID=2652248 RepID=UPI0029461F16|nr:peptidase [Haloechinothrix sp. LS1_15]MDV6013799.1 peptidase [Haloechinothrix sp. LS1_15]
MRSLQRVCLTLFSTATLAVLSAPSSAVQAGIDSDSDVLDVATDTMVDVDHVTGSWSAERMRSATPVEQLISRDGHVIGLADVLDVVPGGEPVSVPATPRSTGLLGGGGASGEPWTGGGKVSSTVGRVFFTYDGEDASCSGNAVTSDNGSTVLTAGHCVRMDGQWHDEWVFVPGYQDGQAPHGTWPAAALLATEEWVAGEDLNHDVGAAVVGERDGGRLTEVVGGQALAFNQDRRQFMDAFGYPAAGTYDGEQLIHCSGRASNDLFFSSAMGLGCNMTEGSSGGPWFLDFDEQSASGVQNSVNSFGYLFLPGVMYGPYFGESAHQLYQEATAITADPAE